MRCCQRLPLGKRPSRSPAEEGYRDADGGKTRTFFPTDRQGIFYIVLRDSSLAKS
jgi:hypothetical protein